MSAETLTDRLNPARRLPAPEESPAESAAFALALDICDAAHMHGDWSGYRPSTIAGTALFVASAVTTGDYVSQSVTADLVGTTTMSIRTHMQRVAEFALEEIDLDRHSSVDESVLRGLASGESVADVLDVQSVPSRAA